jgi:agmatinase
METYSPNLGRDLSDLKICDLGDLEIPFGNKEKALRKINEVIQKIIDDVKYTVFLGGEHLITLPIVEGFRNHCGDLTVIQFDAHSDLRNEYLGEDLSHSTVMRRVLEIIGAEKLFQRNSVTPIPLVAFMSSAKMASTGPSEVSVTDPST